MSLNKIWLACCAQHLGPRIQRVVESLKLLQRNTSKPVRNWPVRCATAGLFITSAACTAVPAVKNIDPKTLTHEYLIKQACNVTVDSSTQLFTLTVVALLDVNANYRESLERLISLLEETLQTETSIVSSVQDEIWDEVIEVRSQTDELKRTLLELTSFLEYVEKTANSAAETSYLSGALYSSQAMCERISSGRQQLFEDREKTKQLEGQLLEIQQSHVYQTVNIAKKRKLPSKLNIAEVADALTNKTI